MAASLEKEELTYSSLVNRWRRERATPGLTRMDHNFYDVFDKHLRALHEDYQREQAVNPATPKVLILLDELTNLQRVRDDLYDLRERKIITAALIAARDGRPDKSNMTREEDALYDSLRKGLGDAREALLRQQRNEPKPIVASGPPTPLEPAPPIAVAAQPALSIAPPPPPEAPLDGGARAQAPSAPAAVADAPRVGPARVLVRVKQAIEPFVAPDLRHYRLMAEDVAALPRDVAQVLVARGLASVLG